MKSKQSATATTKWWDRPTVLMGATLFGFALFQVLLAVKAYLGSV